MSAQKKFGGSWTVRKLDILERYLDAYTTALKEKPFRLIYIDAFAGSGEIDSRAHFDDAKSFIDGSARIALEIESKRFDEIVFNDKDKNRCQVLKHMANQDQRVQVCQGDANQYLRDLRYKRQPSWRAVS